MHAIRCIADKLSLAILFLSGSVFACERPLFIAYSGDWAPYFVNQGPTSYAGTDFLLFEHVLQQLSCSLVVLPMHERRARMEQQKGTVDVFIGATFTQKRAEEFHFSRPYRQETIGFAFLHDPTLPNQDTQRLSQRLARGDIVAMNMDGFFGDQVDDLKQQFPKQFRHAFGIAERAAMLFDERATIIIDDIQALCAFTKLQVEDTHSVARLRLGSEILNQSDVRYMFNKRTVSEDVFTAFDAQLGKTLDASMTAPRDQRQPSCWE